MPEDLIDIVLLVSDSSFYFIAVVAFYCIYKYRSVRSPLTELFHYVFLVALIELVAKIYYVYSNAENNLYLLHILTIGEFILLSLFYRKVIAKPNFKTQGFIVFILFITTLIILNTIFLQDIETYNSYAKSLVQIIVITYAILYFYNLTVDIETINEQNQKSLRLINSSILLYYSGSLFIFMFGNYYKQNPDIYARFWLFNAVLTLVYYLLIFVSIWKATVYQARKYST